MSSSRGGLTAIGGERLDLAHDLFGHVAGDDALVCLHVSGCRGRVGRRAGQDQAGEAGAGHHVGAAALVPGDAELTEEFLGPMSTEPRAAAAALLPHLCFTRQDQEPHPKDSHGRWVPKTYDAR